MQTSNNTFSNCMETNMFTKTLMFCVLVIILMTFFGECEGTADVTELTTSIDRFSNKLMATLNYTHIPFGISGLNLHSLLSMVSLGAQKNTLNQMKQVLGLEKIASSLKPYRILNERMTAQKELNLWSAIKRCEEITILDKFLKETNQVFSALYDEDPSGCEIPDNYFSDNIKGDDFKALHSDVSTSEKPATLIGGISSLEFSADWAYPFDKSHIHKRTHRRSDGTSIQVEYMNRARKYASKSFLNNKIIKIPFRDKRFALYIIISNTDQSLSALEKALKDDDFDESVLFEGLQETVVNFTLPKNAFRHRIFLHSTLMKMGMGEAFSPKADFFKISKTAMFIESVYQEVSFDINNERVVATALTYTYMNHTLNLNNPTPYSSNEKYPYYFFIRDDHLKLNLFEGKDINAS